MTNLRRSIIGAVLILSMAAVCRADESQDEGMPPPGVVHVEPLDLVPIPPPSHEFKMRPYRERRSLFGVLFGVDYSTYQPINYIPQYTINAAFGDIYGQPATPLLEGQLVVKLNTRFGSIGVELGYGSYQNNSANAQIPSTLNLQQERVGLILVLDTLFSQPYAAPYASAGGYVMQYNESLAANTFKGSTQVAPYFTLGVMGQLDWIEPASALQAYEAVRLQSTFLFAEVREYFRSAKDRDPAFETGLVPGGGLRVEF